MAASSINTFSLKPQPEFHNPKTLKPTIHSSLKPPKPIHTQKALSLSSNLRPTSLKPLHFSTNCSNLPIFQKPTSNSSSLRNFSKFCTEKIAILVFGSFVFIGSVNIRPVIALPQQRSTYSRKLKEQRKTEKGESAEEEMYEMLLKENPKDVEAFKMVFNEKMSKGKIVEAVEYVKKLIKVEPNEIEWRLLEALCYEMMGEWSRAKRLFKEILTKRPLLLRALHGLAMVMHKKHEGPAAIEMLNKALELARREKRVTEERSIRILIAQMHVVEGELEEGLKDFQILVAEDPRDFRPYLCQGIIYSLMEKKKEAEEQFEIYRSLAPEEFPQRGFLDDVVSAAKTGSKQPLGKGFYVTLQTKQ